MHGVVVESAWVLYVMLVKSVRLRYAFEPVLLLQYFAKGYMNYCKSGSLLLSLADRPELSELRVETMDLQELSLNPFLFQKQEQRLGGHSLTLFGNLAIDKDHQILPGNALFSSLCLLLSQMLSSASLFEICSWPTSAAMKTAMCVRRTPMWCTVSKTDRFLLFWYTCT